MTIDIAAYLAEVQKIYATGQATEHSYRPALDKLFKSIDPKVNAVNEPTGIKVGRPDFVFIREVGKGANLTVGHCEAKDVGLELSPKGMNDFNKAQHDRYVKALPNLVYTNALDFRFYKKGELVREISIADLLIGIQPKPDQFSVLANQLKDFAAEKLQTIESAEKLAEMMAGKATLIKDILFNSLKDDANLQTELVGQYQSFKDQLIHDLTAEDFADIYSETIAYGMFGARLHDKTLENFSRVEALELMPKSNPFLRALFTYVAGPDLDERIRRTVDELAEIFQATNLQKLFEDFGKFTQRNDPFIHFYETFLGKYNPAKRKARGVWYTPEPVVNFIVRAVDDVLKTEFGLADGLADTSKVTVKDWDTGQKDKKGNPILTNKEMHRVQILDPAAGTGTFLAEVIKQIAPRVKDVAEGQWSSYVEKELIPRLHGFELLMASYAMCHMKLDMMLTEMGYKPTSGNPPRLGVYLTNSLEEGEKANQTLPFAQWLSNEAKEASTIKRDMPIMCVIGNPPYSGISTNVGTGFKWIDELVACYKKEPNSAQKLEERKHWLDDDYVKFIRLAEHLIDKNDYGILGFITNHGYLDNPTFRGMRWHMLMTFDKIWVLDLHGNAKKQEVGPGGLLDKNIFDIQQGVSIIVAVKNKKKTGVLPSEVWHGELWGAREVKNQKLWETKLSSEKYQQVFPEKPQYYFVPKNFELSAFYETGFSVDELFIQQSVGFVSARDSLNISFSRSEMEGNIQFLLANSSQAVRQKFNLGDKDARDWKLETATADAKRLARTNSYIKVSYRPFDDRFTCYTGTSRGLYASPQSKVMSQFIDRSNLGFVTVSKQLQSKPTSYYWVANKPISNGLIRSDSVSIDCIRPLYLYPDEKDLDQTRRVNFDPKIHKAIVAAATGPSRPAEGRAPQGEGNDGSVFEHPLPPDGRTPPALRAKGENVVPDEVAIFDYIYGVLHCPAYRETYKEFLKIDFPRVPYPPSPEVFWDVSGKGTQLRKLHLMEDAAIGAAPFKFVGVGDSVVAKVSYVPSGSPLSVSKADISPARGENEVGSVFVNATQCFENVPRVAWEFYIGGYQPAQKWLKDRKGRELVFDDIKHYQKIIKILLETDRIMKTIEMPL